jgi:dTDP-glucose 4,6-dehydratase
VGRLLVAGGAGFVGSHLVDRLVARGDEVVVVDDLTTGLRTNLPDACAFVEGDVTQTSTLARLGGLGRFDAVLHLASPASPPAFLARPIATLDVGSIGTRHLLELAREHEATFLLASTSEVYGDPLVHPQPEDYWGNTNPVGVRSCYDEAKRFAEALTMAFTRTYGMVVRIARIFNTYGPRMQADDGRVVTNLVHQALAGAPLTLYGGGQTRSFCYVDDLVNGLVALLDGPITGPVNLGNPNELTIRELAELILDLTGSTSVLDDRPLPADDPRVRCPDITLAETELGWRPTVDLRTGMRRTIDAFAAALPSDSG